MKRIVFLDPAEEEMLKAAVYYQTQTRGLGEDFITEVRHTVERIEENPESGKVV